MTTYVKATDFAVKDSLLKGNPAKLVKGTEINAEFVAIQAADATNLKSNGAGAVDNSIVRFDGTSGLDVQNSVVSISDIGAISGATNITEKTSSTGAAILPVGTTAQRDGSPANGYLRYNSTSDSFEGYRAGSWGSIGGGSSGGMNANNRTNATGYENDAFVDANFTVGQSAQAACTISIASPCVVTQANTFTAGQTVRFTTTGALPTGITVNGGPYYVLSAGLSTSSFRISLTEGGAAINTSGTQSGTHTCGALKHMMAAGPYRQATDTSTIIPTGSRLVVL